MEPRTRATGSAAALTALIAAAAGCTDPAPLSYYDPQADTDIGGGHDDALSDAGPDQPSGSPCSEDSPWPCDPITSQGCAGTDSACDYGVSNGVTGFFCFTDGTEPAGSACGQDAGPWCASGSTCMGGLCTPYCCSQDDCDPGTLCEAVDWEYLDAGIGLCLPDGDAGADAGR